MSRKQNCKVVCLFVLSLVCSASAGTIIVGDDLLNGNFNALIEDSAADSQPFSNTVAWVNLLDGPMEATRTNIRYDGTRNAVLSRNAIFGLDTGHAISAGESFNVAYVWRDAWAWDDASTEVRVALFITDDDTIEGNRTDLVVVLSGVSTANNGWEEVKQDAIYTATEVDAGKILFVAIDSTMTNNGYGRVENFVLSEGNLPVAHLTLDANDIVAVEPNDPNGLLVAVDVTGNGYDADLTGQTEVVGAIGEALAFDGASFITLIDSNSLPLNNADHTVSLWLNTISGVSQQVLTHTNPSNEHVAQDRCLGMNDTHTSPGPKLALDHGWVGICRGNTDVNDGEWHHVAYTVEHDYVDANEVTYHIETVLLYVDGVVDANAVWTEDKSWNPGPDEDFLVNLGGGISGNWFTNPLDGALDDLQIFDAALTEEEILALAGIESTDPQED